MRYNITAIYVCIDDFCKIYEKSEQYRSIVTAKQRCRSSEMSLNEMLTIMVIFHFSPCKNFKYFYNEYLKYAHKADFQKFLSYSRFVQLMPRLFVPLCILLHTVFGEKTGIYVTDSTSLPVCDNKRITRNRVFNGLAARGKTTMGWFFGLKLHLVINHKGSIVAVKITPGNTDDRSVLDTMTRYLKGSIFGDKGYISKSLFSKLYTRGLKLITGIRRNMNNYLMPLIDKVMLRKRYIIETIFGILKQDMNLSHSRHRSPINACVNTLSCLVAYQLRSHKPSLLLSQSLIQN